MANSFSQAEIIELLKGGVYKTTFTKLDGSVRTLNATLHEDFVSDHDEDYFAPSSNSIVVWSVLDDGFRTIQVSTISDFEKI